MCARLCEDTVAKTQHKGVADDDVHALTSVQAGDFLGLSPKTLANWRAQGVGPSYIRYSHGRAGRIAYRHDDLIAFMEAHRVATAGGAR